MTSPEGKQRDQERREAFQRLSEQLLACREHDAELSAQLSDVASCRC